MINNHSDIDTSIIKPFRYSKPYLPLVNKYCLYSNLMCRQLIKPGNFNKTQQLK